MTINNKIEKSRFKNSMGVRFLKELFFETTSIDKTNVLYTLKNDNHEGYPSLYKIYMSYNDPTEYQFAIDNLADWEHWEKLTECNWFKEYISKWRREVEMREKSKALQRIIEESRSGSRESFNANKYLLEKKWLEKETSSRGRPSKEEIKSLAEKEMKESSSILQEQAERLGIKVSSFRN